MNIEERHSERDRRDAGQNVHEKDMLSKLYRMEFFVTDCESCSGHRQRRYVAVDEVLMTRKEFIASLDLEAAIAAIPQWIRIRLSEDLFADSLARIIVKAALGEDAE